MIKWFVRLGLAFVATKLAAKYMTPGAEAADAPAPGAKRRRTAK